MRPVAARPVAARPVAGGGCARPAPLPAGTAPWPRLDRDGPAGVGSA